MLPAYSVRMAQAGNTPALRSRPAASRADFVNGPEGPGASPPFGPCQAFGRGAFFLALRAATIRLASLAIMPRNRNNRRTALSSGQARNFSFASWSASPAPRSVRSGHKSSYLSIPGDSHLPPGLAQQILGGEHRRPFMELVPQQRRYAHFSAPRPQAS